MIVAWNNLANLRCERPLSPHCHNVSVFLQQSEVKEIIHLDDVSEVYWFTAVKVLSRAALHLTTRCVSFYSYFLLENSTALLV